MTVYLKLIQGPDDPDQQMDDWGFNGPTLGPFEAVHFTYLIHIRCIAADGSEAPPAYRTICSFTRTSSTEISISPVLRQRHTARRSRPHEGREAAEVFVQTIACRNYDGEKREVPPPFVMENDDAVSMLNELIEEARLLIAGVRP